MVTIEGIPGKPVTSVVRSNWFYGAVAISLLLHAAVGIVLIYKAGPQPAEPEVAAIQVDIVPPPEPPEPKLELSEQEAPEPPAPEPPPPPENQPETEEQLAQAPLPVLKPVIEFGEEDSGPQVNPDGLSKQEPDGQELDEPELDEPENSEAETIEAEEPQEADTEPSEVLRHDSVEPPNEQQPDLPGLSELALETDTAEDPEASPDDPGMAGPLATLVTPPSEPVLEPAEAALEKTGTPEELSLVEQLFSESILGDESAVRTAIGNRSRSDRANILCMTEMRGQLLARRPPLPAEMLPTFVLSSGTVLEPEQAAFRSQGKWYDLAFRCEVNEEVTKVVNFSYRVGEAIPRAQWPQRGFPSF